MSLAGDDLTGREGGRGEDGGHEAAGGGEGKAGQGAVYTLAITNSLATAAHQLI